jgi:hypothetical protein
MATAVTPRKWRSWRRKLLDQDLVDELAGYFREGATVKIAAGRVGLPPGVLRMWLREGENQLSEIYGKDVGYPEQEGLLYVACAKATAEYLAAHVGTVSDPGDAEWRASSWLLERRDEDFNPAAKVEVSGPEGGPIVVEGHTIVGWADLIELAERTGQGHLIGLAGRSDGADVPGSQKVLPAPAHTLGPAVDPAGVQGS